MDAHKPQGTEITLLDDMIWEISVVHLLTQMAQMPK